ncbi:MAG: DUF4838 domain-containing protein [Kiritimatiellae bacterium]|nr:DUF4838 domain-containing protein [Kiritimatiellia bacterium]
MLNPRIVNRRFLGAVIAANLLSVHAGWGRSESDAGLRLELTREGQPAASIVIASDASRIARLAAAELQYHIAKISGATLPVEETRGDGQTRDHSARPRILVGESDATRALGFRSADFKHQEYLVHFAPNTVVLIGRDKPDPGVVNHATGQGFPDMFDEQGTMYATYDFLERFCGVRWYLPSDLGITFDPRPTLTVAGADVRRRPAMQQRFVGKDYRYPADLCGDTVATNKSSARLPDREHLLWLYRNRMGGTYMKVNHSLYGYYGRFLKTHPEWFAKGYDQEQPPQMCYTSTGLLAQVVRDARDFFDGKATNVMVAAGDYFAIVPMDNRSWCKCADCQALLLTEATRGASHYAKNDASDYILGFVNRVAREVRKTHPDKWIITLGYSDYSYPPEDGKMEPNVTVGLCLSPRFWFSAGTRDNEQAVMDVWQTVGAPLSLWMYYCFPSFSAVQGGYRMFPAFFASQIAGQNKVFRKAGVVGMKYEPSYLAHSQQSALLDQLEFYVTWRLADDPALDGEALIDEFFTRYYGSAAAPMQRFYERCEEIWWNPTNHPSGVTGAELAWRYQGTPERMRELGGYMDQALKAVTNDPYRARVALFEKGIWQYMRKGAEDYRIAAEAPLHSVTVPRVAAPADSDPRKLDWARAGVLDGWRKLDGSPTSKNVEGRMLHDGTNLYLRLVDMIAPSVLVDRGGIWNSDEYELFVGGQRGRSHRQLGIDFKGRSEAYRYGESGGKVWESGAVIVSDIKAPDRWTLYVTLPLDRLLPGGVLPGSTFYMNVIRSMKISVRPFNAVAWNATLGGFRAPGRMGEVVLK